MQVYLFQKAPPIDAFRHAVPWSDPHPLGHIQQRHDAGPPRKRKSGMIEVKGSRVAKEHGAWGGELRKS